MPKCYERRHENCQCFKEIIDSIVVDDNNYLERTIEWLKKNLNEVEKHINLDNLLNTTNFKFVKTLTLLNSYKHFLISLDKFETLLRQNYSEDLNFNLVIRIREDREIPILTFLNLVKNLCKAYCEALTTLFKPFDNLDISFLLEIIRLHINYLQPLDTILKSISSEKK